MPILHSAIKKMHQDKKRAARNKSDKDTVKKQIKEFLKNTTVENYRKTVGLIDRLAKKHIFHKNKAARIKSRLSRALAAKGK